MENDNLPPTENSKPEITLKLNRGFSIKDIILGVIIAVLVCLIIVSWVRDRAPRIDRTGETTSEMLEATVQQIAHLATLSLRYSEVLVHDDQNTISIFRRAFNIPGTTRFMVVRWQADMLFGIDADDIRVSFIDHDETRKVRVSLPNTRILSHAVDLESIEVLNESTGIFTSFASDDLVSFVAGQQSEIEARETTTQLLESARRSTEEVVYALLHLTLLDEVEHIISFVWR